jgi:hypothetical protein
MHRNVEPFLQKRSKLKHFLYHEVVITDTKKVHFKPSFVMNRTDSTTSGGGRIHLFHLAKMVLIGPLSAMAYKKIPFIQQPKLENKADK